MRGCDSVRLRHSQATGAGRAARKGAGPVGRRPRELPPVRGADAGPRTSANISGSASPADTSRPCSTMPSRTRTRSRTIPLPPYSTDLRALRDRETPIVVPIPAPKNPDVKGPSRELEDRVARAQKRGWHEDRYWLSCRARPTGERWTEQGQDILCHVSPDRYFRERLEQTSSITTTLMAVGRAEMEDATRADIVEELMGTYEDELGRCALPPEVLAVVRRAGFDLESRSSRFYDVARRLRTSLLDGKFSNGWEARKLCRQWVLEQVVDREINQVQGAALELLIELFVLQSAEDRDLEAARENATCPSELPAAIEDLRRSGDAKVPVLARRLTKEGVPIEIEGRSGGRAEIACARLHPMREEGLCPEPPVFTG